MSKGHFNAYTASIDVKETSYYLKISGKGILTAVIKP